MSNAAILACYREAPVVLQEEYSQETWVSIGGMYRLEVQPIVPGNEANYGLMWLYSTLSGDATLATYAPGGVWTFIAPTTTATPFVMVGFQSGMETLTFNAVRLFTQPLYQVRAMGRTNDMANIQQAASQIDALLGRTSAIGYI